MNKISLILTLGMFIALFSVIPATFAATTGGYDCFGPDGSPYNSGTYDEGPKAGQPIPCSVAGRVADESGFNLKDIFGWSIGIGSIVAMGVMTYGGTKYAASGLFGEHASSDQINEGKRWIFAGLEGLAILIAAFLIINTLNPAILLF